MCTVNNIITCFVQYCICTHHWMYICCKHHCVNSQSVTVVYSWKVPLFLPLHNLVSVVICLCLWLTSITEMCTEELNKEGWSLVWGVPKSIALSQEVHFWVWQPLIALLTQHVPVFWEPRSFISFCFNDQAVLTQTALFQWASLFAINLSRSREILQTRAPHYFRIRPLSILLCVWENTYFCSCFVTVMPVVFFLTIKSILIEKEVQYDRLICVIKDKTPNQLVADGLFPVVPFWPSLLLRFILQYP